MRRKNDDSLLRRIHPQKAREILEELQRRTAERGRPINELKYIDWLRRRF
jgi:hypothetical protein